MSFNQGAPKVDEKQFALPAIKWKGFKDANGVKEDINGRYQRGSPLTPKPKLHEREKGQERKPKGRKNH
jgi:hypothetical protein